MTRGRATDEAPDVSVLVLAYNHELYLSKALDGILGQDFKGSIEVLIGEDCSNDDTLTIAEDYVARHAGVVRIVTAPENVGMYANHARLVRAARAPVIAYCEGDDWWHDSAKLTDQMDLLAQHQDWVGVHSDFDHCVERGGLWWAFRDYARRRRHVPTHPVGFDDLLVRNLVQTCTLLLRRSAALAYMDSPFAQGNYGVDDWPLTLFCTSGGARIGCLGRSTASYRRTPGSVTNSAGSSQLPRIRRQHQMAADFATRYPQGREAAAYGSVVTTRAVAQVAVRELDTPTARAELAAWGHVASTAPEKFLVRVLSFAARGPWRHAMVRNAISVAMALMERAAYRAPSRNVAGT